MTTTACLVAASAPKEKIELTGKLSGTEKKKCDTECPSCLQKKPKDRIHSDAVEPLLDFSYLDATGDCVCLVGDSYGTWYADDDDSKDSLDASKAYLLPVTIRLTSGNDCVFLEGNGNDVYGLDGDDVIEAAGYYNNIYGGAGDDTLRGSVFTYIRGDVGYDECWDDGKPYLHKGCEGPLTPTQQPVAGKDKKKKDKKKNKKKKQKKKKDKKKDKKKKKKKNKNKKKDKKKDTKKKKGKT